MNRQKLWNKSFFLLWQGQLVSVFGDALYVIALNFFVLELTGSTAIMGTVMALVTIPRILLGPLSGVIVDRSDRKKLIILGDLIRGICILFIALAARNEFLKMWMIMAVAIVSGVCSSFFNPAIESVLPDIIPAENMTRGTSIYQIATTGADILGQSVGGALYTLAGVTVMFLIDGVSYLFSAFTEAFIDVPKGERKNVNLTFLEDFKDGIRFLFQFQGLVRVILISFFFNFLFGMIRVLIIPWFADSPHLGMTRYGILGAVQSVGLIVGMLLLSIITIKPQQRYRTYLSSLFLFIACIGAGAFFNQYLLILVFFFLAFGFQFVFNTVLNSTVMLRTPTDKRGKVLATKTTLGMAVSPLGNFIGGVLGEFVDPRVLILLCVVTAAIISAAVVIHPAVRQFLSQDEVCG